MTHTKKIISIAVWVYIISLTFITLYLTIT